MADDNSTGHVFDEDLRRDEQPAAALVDGRCSSSPSCSRSPTSTLFPGLGGVARQRSAGPAAASSTSDQAQGRRGDGQGVRRLRAASRPTRWPQDARAMAIGQRLFINNCATCHGSDARGSKGFPNLTDRDWLHGGTPEKIEETITLGRTGIMPPMAAAVGSAAGRAQRRQLRAEPVGQPAQRDRRRSRAGRSSSSAPPATAPTARATRRSARPT